MYYKLQLVHRLHQDAEKKGSRSVTTHFQIKYKIKLQQKITKAHLKNCNSRKVREEERKNYVIIYKILLQKKALIVFDVILLVNIKGHNFYFIVIRIPLTVVFQVQHLSLNKSPQIYLVFLYIYIYISVTENPSWDFSWSLMDTSCVNL